MPSAQRSNLISAIAAEATQLGETLATLQTLMKKYAVQAKKAPFTQDDFIGENADLTPETVGAALALLATVLEGLPEGAFDTLYMISRN